MFNNKRIKDLQTRVSDLEPRAVDMEVRLNELSTKVHEHGVSIECLYERILALEAKVNKPRPKNYVVKNKNGKDNTKANK